MANIKNAFTLRKEQTHNMNKLHCEKHNKAEDIIGFRIYMIIKERSVNQYVQRNGVLF